MFKTYSDASVSALDAVLDGFSALGRFFDEWAILVMVMLPLSVLFLAYALSAK